jgi:putative FmdB family regulatory protein
MPTYEYRCLSCEHQFERFQRMSDDPVTECEVCGQAVKRLLFPVAIHFKGSGFYCTDYGKRSSKAAGTPSRESFSSESASTDSGADPDSFSSSDGAADKSAADRSGASAPAVAAAAGRAK